MPKTLGNGLYALIYILSCKVILAFKNAFHMQSNNKTMVKDSQSQIIKI